MRQGERPGRPQLEHAQRIYSVQGRRRRFYENRIRATEEKKETKRRARFEHAVTEFSKPQPELVDIPGDNTKISHHFERAFMEIKRGDKIHRQIGTSILSIAFLPVPVVGNVMIGLLNGINTVSEFNDARNHKGSYVRAALYALATLWEFVLIPAPQIVMARIGVQALLRVFGQWSGNVVGALTGFLTNTALWEMGREKKRENKQLMAVEDLQPRISSEYAKSVIQDPQTLRENVNQFLTGDKNLSSTNNLSKTNLGHLQTLLNSIAPSTEHKWNLAKRLIKKIMRGYYKREIKIENIKRDTAQNLLDILDNVEAT